MLASSKRRSHDWRSVLEPIIARYGTNLANVGTPVQTLKTLMGHSSIQTTMEFYLQSSDENEKKAVFELDRIMG